MPFLSLLQVPTAGGRKRCFSQEEAKEIRRLYDEENFSYRDLAKRYKCHIGTINKVILGRGAYSYLGARSAKKKPKKLTDQEILNIKRMYIREDLLIPEIAQRLARHPQTVRRVIEFYDW